MTLTDKNRIFFALIHYILVEQKNVDWILKTSLIDFTGISSLLEERPYKTDSILDDVVDMITQIKPYHVQFSHYFEHYQTHQEDVDVNVKDWLETLVHMRFDALKSTPDLNMMFDRYVTGSQLPSGKIYNEKGELIFDYDRNGIVIYFENDKDFYIRKRNDDGYHWEKTNSVIYDDGFYYGDGKFYKGKNGSLQRFTSDDADELIDSHRANRLFYMGLHDSDEIRKELNANFKGLEIVGSSFDIGKFGYDIFNYDTTDYDSPTVIYDYYFLNNLIEDLVLRDSDQSIIKTIPGEKTEVNELFGITDKPVTKTFFSTSKERFDLPSDWPSGSIVKVYKLINGNLNEYLNYEIVINGRDHYLDMFSTMKDREKVFVIKYNTNNVPDAVHVAECTIYGESDSKTLKRQVVYVVDGIDTYNLPTPTTMEGNNDKIAVQKVTYRGSRKPILSPDIQNGNLVQSMVNINIYEHISMVSFDFKYLYDKIYTWEDKYGRSNNVVYLNGDNFYRARYESDRPSELVVSNPINTLFVYNDDDSKKNILFNDFKNKQLQTQFLSSTYTTIKSLNTTQFTERITEDRSVTYDLINSIEMDSVKGFEDAPGKVLINSEIILYNEIDRNTNTISDLKRACDGTFLFINGDKENDPDSPHDGDDEHLTHEVGDKVYPIHEDEWIESKRNNVYKSYNVRSSEQKIYECPSGLKKTSTVRVKRLKSIKLLEDVTLNTQTIKISSAEVVDKESYKKLLNRRTVEGSWILQINDDSIPFTTIYPDSTSNGYCIENFVLPEKYVGYGNDVIYSADNTVISGCLTSFINDFTVQMVEGDFSYDIVIENDETYIKNEHGDNLFRIIGSEIETSIDEQGRQHQEIVKIGNIINVYCAARNDVSNDFYEDEIYFGNIGKDNLVYKDDGTVYGKIEGNKLIQVLTQITINEDLNKNDNLLINIHNFKYSSSENDNW